MSAFDELATSESWSYTFWLALLIVLLSAAPRILAILEKRSTSQKVNKFVEEQTGKASSVLHGKRVLCIANPNSGSRKAIRAYEEILKPMCEACGIEVELSATDHAGHAKMIADKAGSQGHHALVMSLSGDGMTHEVVEGLVDAEGKMRTALAVLPCGSSNGLAKSLYNTVDIFEAAEIILLKGVEKPANLISAQGADGKAFYDVMGVSHGIAMDVAALSEDTLRWMNRLPAGGMLKDITAALKSIIFMRRHKTAIKLLMAPLTPEDVSVRHYSEPEKRLQPTTPPPGGRKNGDGGVWYEINDDMVFFELLNIEWLAYDMQLGPGLRPTGGDMDIILSRGHTKLQLLGSFLKVDKGEHVHDEWIERYKVTQVAITPKQGTGFRMSGEIAALESDGEAKPVLATCHENAALLWQCA